MLAKQWKFWGFAALLSSTQVFAQSNTVFDSSSAPKQDGDAWSINFDNDFFAPGSSDRDYTFGLSARYTSEKLSENPLMAPLYALDDALGFCEGGKARHQLELGFYAFTPEQPELAQPNESDRPFASLIYASVANERVDPDSRSVFRSQLTLGVLGLPLVGDIQNEVHEWLGNEQEQGWQHQISEGGEPTFRYSLAKQNLLFSGEHLELKHTRAASLGYITEASWGLNLRVGNMHSAWHSFSPEIATYAEGSARRQQKFSEGFFWAGMALKARAYNVFLQGQFRDSSVSYDFDDLNHGILEAWMGYTQSFRNGVFFSYGLRGHSAEIKSGPANRNVIWGGLMLGRSLS
jgi:hypothetical protein